MDDDFTLRRASSDAWLQAVLADFNAFLTDHAANERKASAMAMSMVAHYPDRARLVEAMVDLALEELNHFRQVLRIMTTRHLTLAPDEKDPYVNGIRRHIRRGTEPYFLDRLLTAAVIEARGAERFSLLAGALQEPGLRSFYETLAKSESGHHQLFIDLATGYFSQDEVRRRFLEWRDIEEEIIDALPVRARLH